VNGPVCESYLRFNLPAGSRHHEEVNPDGPGVDFEIASTPPVWLEVKNWDAPVIPPEHRWASNRDYADKTKTTSPFWDDMVSKFEGTHDCLEALGQRPSDVRLGVLLESHLFSGMALAPAISILEARIGASDKVGGCPLGVINTAGLATFVMGAAATPCSVTSSAPNVCAAPVLRCSVVRRLHGKSIMDA
jgi:hypothetical protein